MNEQQNEQQAAEAAERAEWDRRHQERLAQREAHHQQDRAQALRVEALKCATEWASGEGWNGSSAHVVAAAQVFEHYLSTGKLVSQTAFRVLYQDAQERKVR